MQEQIEREAIAIVVKTTQITTQTLASAFRAVCRKIEKDCNKIQTPHGKQSIKKLMNHNCPTSTIPIEGDKGLFEHVARKWHVDYAFHKTGPGKYLLLFKTGQADAITAAFSEYSNRVIKRARENRKPVMEKLRRASEQIEHEIPNRPKHNRTKEVTRE